MDIWLLLAALFTLLIGLRLQAARAAKGRQTATLNKVKRRKTESYQDHDNLYRVSYSSVEIQADEDCCDQIKPFIGRRYLSVEAPKLPLAECNAKRCNCRYRHYADRRDDHERRDVITTASELYVNAGNADRRERRRRAFSKRG